MLKPSIDTLPDKQKHQIFTRNLVSKTKAHELEAGATPTQELNLKIYTVLWKKLNQECNYPPRSRKENQLFVVVSKKKDDWREEEERKSKSKSRKKRRR